MILTFAVWPHGKHLPNPKIWKSAWPDPWIRNAGKHSGKDDCTWHYAVPSGDFSLCVGYILYIPHVFVWGFLCVHTILYQREIPSLVLEAWGPVFVVDWNSFICLKLHWRQPKFVFCMHHGWKTGNYINSRPAEITTTTPHFWPCCLWHPDEKGNSSVTGEEPFTAKKRDETSISSHQMVVNIISFPSTNRLILNVTPGS